MSDQLDESAAIVAGNIRQSGKTKMANKEIAECAYRPALGLKAWKHPYAASLERVVRQVMLADRWEAQLRRLGAKDKFTVGAFSLFAKSEQKRER
ncbi:MAG: hypothetical protein E5X77_09385 [Mesorhizobium sp.]|nr:MAG: hypothetical protein E5X77_09385 [Mesorhizobium sp.]